ncbi:hypothetical protein [Pedobacter nutrimenti]|uniref:Uncharacterized protein n=1 Tax=Pedobacter nutrimenti TaxID=1241337 RepID=A0A318UDD4_9SPHI|nr:hypothetical protein [Pedobacter nutrimenti]PYF74093.1 hypothetical protein B0O44_104264 [Pedobacter nutrimenti]
MNLKINLSPRHFYVLTVLLTILLSFNSCKKNEKSVQLTNEANDAKAWFIHQSSSNVSYKVV